MRCRSDRDGKHCQKSSCRLNGVVRPIIPSQHANFPPAPGPGETPNISSICKNIPTGQRRIPPEQRHLQAPVVIKDSMTRGRVILGARSADPGDALAGRVREIGIRNRAAQIAARFEPPVAQAVGRQPLAFGQMLPHMFAQQRIVGSWKRAGPSGTGYIGMAHP